MLSENRSIIPVRVGCDFSDTNIGGFNVKLLSFGYVRQTLKRLNIQIDDIANIIHKYCVSETFGHAWYLMQYLGDNLHHPNVVSWYVFACSDVC